MSRIDTIGSSALGVPPRFPAPVQLLPDLETVFPNQLRPELPRRIAQEWTAKFPSHSKLIGIFDDLCALTYMVENEALQSRADQEPRFTGFYILPLVHRLLTLKAESDSLFGAMLFESCKLGALLYLQNLRQFVARRYPCLKMPFIEVGKPKTESLGSSCVTKLAETMVGHDSVWTTLLPLKCWVVIVCLNSSFRPPGHDTGLFLLARSPLYAFWCKSMGCLIGNSWTHSY